MSLSDDMRMIPNIDARPKRPLKGLGLIALVLGACATLAFPLERMTRDHKGTLDFANFYMAGKIVSLGQSHSLYDLALQREIEQRVSPSGPFLPYYHPPFEALFFAAFASLSYPHAFLLWAAMNLGVLCLLIYLLGLTGYRLATGGYLMWLAVTVLLAIGVVLLGQDSLLLALVFLLVFLALKRHRHYAAGFALGLGLFRFEIVAPFACIFLLRKRWSELAGFGTACIAALTVSVGLVGWQGLWNYASALLQVGASARKWAAMVNVATMPSLHGAVVTLLGGVFPPKIIFSIDLLGALALLVWAASEFKSISSPGTPTFDLEFALAVVATLLASYYLFVHELTPLIVVAFLMLGYESTRRREGILGNRRGTALLFVFVVVYGVGGAVFHFQDFSVLSIVLLGLIVWLSQQLSFLRQSNRLSHSNP